MHISLNPQFSRFPGHSKGVAQSTNGTNGSPHTTVASPACMASPCFHSTSKSASWIQWAHQTIWPSYSMTSSDSEALAVSVSISPSSVVLKEMSFSWSSRASISTRVLANHLAYMRPRISSSMTLSKIDKISKTSQSIAAFYLSLSVSESRLIPKSVSSISLSASAIRGLQTTVRPSASLSLSNSLCLYR